MSKDITGRKRDIIDDMYDDLYNQGYLKKDRETFRNFFFAPGEQGYKNRKALYDDLHGQGYLEAPTYEDFSKRIGLHAVPRQQQSSAITSPSTPTASAGEVNVGQPEEPKQQQQVKPTKPKKNAVPAWIFRAGMQMAGVNPNNPADNAVSRMVNPATGAKRHMTNAMKMDEGRRATIGVKDNGQVGAVAAPKALDDVGSPEQVAGYVERTVRDAVSAYDFNNDPVAEVKTNAPEAYTYLSNRLGDQADGYIQFLQDDQMYRALENDMRSIFDEEAAAADERYAQAYDEQRSAWASSDPDDAFGKAIMSEIAARRAAPAGAMIDKATSRALSESPAARRWLERTAEKYYAANGDQIKSNSLARQELRDMFRYMEMARRMPKSDAEYILKSVFMGNMYALMGRAVASNGSGDYEGDVLHDESMEAYRRYRAGTAAKVAAPVLTLGFDILGGGFYPAGAGAKLVGTGAQRLLVGAGQRLFGIGAEAATRRIGSSLASRMFVGALSGAANFGIYESESTALRGAAQGNFSLADVAKGGASGAVKGFVFGTVGGVTGKLTEGLTGVNAVLGEIGTLSAEGTVFTAMDVLSAKTPEERREALEPDRVATNFGMGLAGRAAHPARYVADMYSRISGKAAPVPEAPKMSDDTYRRLAENYPELAELLHNPSAAKDLYRLAKNGFQPNAGAERTQAVDGAVTLYNPNAKNDAERSSAIVSSNLARMEAQLEQMKGDKDVPHSVVRMAEWVLNGKLMPAPLVMGWNITVSDNGKSYGETLDAQGRVIDRFELKNGAEQREWQRAVAERAEGNTVMMGIQSARARQYGEAIHEACDQIARQNGWGTETFYEKYLQQDDLGNQSFSEAFERVREVARELMEQREDIATTILSQVEGKYGVKMEEVLDKDFFDRSAEEKKAVDEYISRLAGEEHAELEDMSTEEIAKREMDAARRRGYDADEQDRRDIAIEAADPNNAEAQEAWNGVVERINEDADNMATQQREQAKQMQHADGTFRRATLKERNEDGTDKEVYIVDGHVQMFPDGSMVDASNSDKSVAIYDPATGERKMIDPSADTGIMSLGDVSSAEDFEAGIEAMRQQYVQSQLDDAQGIVHVEPGQQITLPTGEVGVVIAIGGDGEDVAVQLADGTQTSVTRSELQQAADDTALADYNQRHGIVEEQAPAPDAEPQQADGVVAGAPEDYTSGLELTVLDEDNMEKPAMVMGRVRYEDGQFVPDESGNIVEFLMDGEVKHEHADKLDGMVVSHVPMREEAANVDETPVQEEQPPVAENEMQPVEEPQGDAMPMIEVNGKMKPDFSKATPQRAHQYIFNERGLSVDNAKKFVENNRKAVEVALDKLSNKEPEMGIDLDEFDEKHGEWEQQMSDTQAQLEYWQAIAAEQARIEQEAVAAQAQETATRQAEQQAEAERKAAEEAAAIEQARKEREALQGVPDWVNDTPVDARARGYRNVNGERVERQGETGGVLFDGGVSGVKFDLGEAREKTFGNNDYKNTTSNGQERSTVVGSDTDGGPAGERGEQADAGGSEPVASGAGPADNRTGVAEDARGGRVVEEPAEPTPLAKAEQETDTAPTDAQKEAGNYKKGHVRIDGFDISIENPKGSERSGIDASGNKWSVTMNNTYGYIRGTEGVDGDHIDVFLSDDPSEGNVYVVDQVNPDGSFDEHKVMYGFPDTETARKAYLSNYKEGWTGLGAITPVSKEEFKKWINSSHRKTKPFADYVGVKTLGDTQLGERPPYTIEPTTYTNKKGKTTPMHLVKFGRELSKDEIRAGKELAKESRGWWDSKQGGFMMRSEESAKALAEALGNEDAVADAQPLSVSDMADATDQAQLQAVDESIKVEQEPQTTLEYDYDREDSVYDTVLAELRNALKPGVIPNIKAIEKQIRDLRKRTKTIEDGIPTAPENTIAKAFSALADLNGRRKAYEQFLIELRKKMAEDERDEALAAHGVKLGDKVTYRGRQCAIHDANTSQVTLDVGLAPVMYEVTDWENVELPKPEAASSEQDATRAKQLFKDTNEGDTYSNDSGLTATVEMKVDKPKNSVVRVQFTQHTDDNSRDGKGTKLLDPLQFMQWLEANRMKKQGTGKDADAFIQQQVSAMAEEFAKNELVRGTLEVNDDMTIENFFHSEIEKYIVEHYQDFNNPNHVAMMQEYFGNNDRSGEENKARHNKIINDVIAQVKSRISKEQEPQSPQQFMDEHFVIGGAGFEEPGGKQEQEPPKSKSKWVNDEDADRFEELRQRMRKKLGGQLNMGLDPEAFAIGVEMSYLMLKHGARKFHEFAKNLLEALGEDIRPYIKALYNGARELPEMADLEHDMTPYDEVRRFDIANFDKDGAKDIIATAEHIVREQEAAHEAEVAKNTLKQQRNEQRKENEEQVAADTETVVGEAEAAAGTAESSVEAAGTEQELNDVVRTIDEQLDKVNDQLALLGYYEAEPVQSDFNEAYGYMRNAEKKAVKNVTSLYKTLVKALGIKDPVVYDAKGKKQKSVYANIAPAGGEVTMRINLDREQGIELYMNFSLSPVGDTDAARDRLDANPDSLQLTGIMYRIEQPKGPRRYLTSNDYFPTDVTVQQMLSGIRNIGKQWLPKEDYVDMAIRIAEENAVKEQEKPKKTSKNKKKDVSSQKQTIPNLFSGLLDDDLNTDNNDTATTRPADKGSREDGQVGNVPADGDGVLDTDGSGRVDGGKPASVPDAASPVADGERTELPRRRSSGSTTGGNDVASEAAQPVPDGGRGVRDGASSDGGHDVGGTAGEAGRVPSRTGEASHRGRGDVKSPKRPEPKFKRNYLYPENASEIDNMQPHQRLLANVEALEVVRNLMRDGREATPEEKDILARYRGWGGVNLGNWSYSTDMMRRNSTGPLARLADVIDELDPDGERGILQAINRAVLTSFYTPTGIARAMNRFAELAGFKGGSYLDPSMGNGVFEGTMSKGVQQRTMIHGIELDWLTGQVARHLYPDANVMITGFEEAGTADNAYDVVASNIPFGDISVNDKSWKHDSSPVRKAAQNKIHNYFAVKMLDDTRPGGLCVIMTSNAILDTKGNKIIRQHLTDNAEVLGVIRLPDNTFKGAGTSVVTDVIFLRKYRDDADREATRSNQDYITKIESPLLNDGGTMKLTNPTDGKTYNVPVNGYFIANSKMMIGSPKAGGQYRADQFGLGSELGTDELAAEFTKLIEKKIVGSRKGKLFDTHKKSREVHQAVSEAYKGSGDYISSGNLVEQDGMIGIVSSTKNKYGDVTSTFTELPALKSKADRVRTMLPIRKAMKQVIDWQIQGMREQDLSQARTELQKAYDEFVKKFGRLNTKDNDFLTEDIDGYTLRALEKWQDGKFAGLSDIFTKNTIKPSLDLTTAKTPHDAISLSLAEYGEINPSFMEDVLGSSWVEQCGDTLFRTPFAEDSYETADAYLSGDVKTKLEQARAAANQDKSFERNVAALEAIQPEDIPFEDINIRMGARWVPAEVYTDFMYDMFGIRKNSWKGNKSGVAYLPEADEYKINVASNEIGGEADAWRTSRLSASEIFEAALKDKTRKVYDTVEVDGVEKKVLNKEATELANGKIQDLRTSFEDWLGQSPEREEMLMRLYNDKFNRTVLRKFDGSHLNVAGLMGKELRPHQKDAVWMLINNRGGIVDHIVGAGKTLVMQSAIMEMRRMGIAKKPMIIGLKATVAQIAKEFREAYPAARILAPTEKDFSKENRKKFMSQIALNDYDCVVLSHDQYCMLPHTEEVERMVIDEQMAQLDAAIEFLYGQSDKSQLTKKQIKGLEKRKANLEAKLASLLDRKIDREFTFEGLGVDYLFVDECQHFKSLPYVTTYDRVAGLGDKKGSQRAVALLNGVRYLQRMHQGDRGTVFLSGTTISNSLSEIYHLLNYLRPSEMQRLGMTTFDAWAGNFAIHTSELEYGVTNELKEKDRFRSLTNIPELSKMYAEITDVRNDMNLKLPKPKTRQHIVTVPQSDIMSEINAEIVEMVKKKNGSYFGIEAKDTTPWGLLASTLSAKAAINPRLIDDTLEDEGGKIPAVCENVKKIYDQFADQKGTQLIFCDTGVSQKGKKYDAYSDIINRLVNDYGIPRKEIVDIHEADTDEKRKALFAKVNDGSVRILIGGTKNMGTGVNVQQRVVAMHHVDVPWTPADLEQRNGRGGRQGNIVARDFNDNNVEVFFYATEGSLDMYKYQLQETKGKLFAQFKSGTIGDRTFDEGDAEGDFDPAEVVAMLSGNPVIFEKSKQDKLVEKLRRAKRAYESDWQRRRTRFEDLQQKRYNYERLKSMNERDMRALERGGFVADESGKYPTTVTVSVKDDYSSRRTFDKPKEAGEYIHELLKKGKAVQLSGFDQRATVTRTVTDSGLFSKPVAQIESYGGIKYTVEVSDDDTAAGVAFRNLLQKIYSNSKVYEQKLEDVNNQLVGADPGEKIFPKQAELDAALAKKKQLDDEYKLLSDDDGKSEGEDNAVYSLREEEPPKKTGIGYKVFVLKDGKLYPPMVANPGGEATPVGVWLNADAAPVAGLTKTGRQQVKAGGKGTQGGSGTLAYRPGWHLGLIPYAKQFNRRNPLTGQRELFPANFVWAEVEYADDVDYQDEAMSYGMNKNGKFQHSLAGLPRVPENGSYRYRTNPDPTTDEWVITGAMKVHRVLTNDEVATMVRENGREPQQRQPGGVTDEQISALNAEIGRNMQRDADMMRKTVEQMGNRLNTPINIITDVESITHPDAKIQQRRRNARGWYDTKTHEVNIVLPNNRDVEEVAGTVAHETIAHKGLRELIGEERYGEFLDETYKHLRDDLKKSVDDAAGRSFIGDPTKDYEQHRRTATDELFGRMAEKPFDEFSEGERTLWQKLKDTVRRWLDQFLGSLKLPKWFVLGDNELRYMLWRSKERLERGKEHPIDLARDFVKREELGLTDEARYMMGDVAEPSFASRRDKAVKEHGYVHAGLNSSEVTVVSIKEKTPFDSSKKTRALKEDVVAYASEHNIIGTMTEEETKGKGKVTISKASIEKMVDDSATDKSVDKDIHLAVIPQLREVIAESIMAETHPDYLKGEDGKHSPKNGYNGNVLIHRCYGAVNIDGTDYRVKITLKEDGSHKGAPHKAYTYEVTKIELLDSTDGEGVPSASYTSNSNGGRGIDASITSVATAKLLQNIEKSYDSGKKILEESKLADEDTALYSAGDDTEDIWNDQSMGLFERITAAATRLASNHSDNKTLRDDAMRAIGGNLSDLRKAMSLQRKFDINTVKRVSDLARVLIDGGYLNGLSQQEVKRLLAAVKNSVGHNDIESDVQKVMDIMVDNQLKNAENSLHELESVKGSKVDARGVEVQGQLDPSGQHVMKVFKKTRGLEKTNIEEDLADAVQRMGSSNAAVAEEAAHEYTGLQFAMEYAENIKDSKVEERRLRDEIKQTHDETSEDDRRTEAYRQYIGMLKEAIRQNKIERAQSYFDLVGRLTDSLRDSIANAQAFKEAEKQRVRDIQHNANSDMEGRPSDEHYKPTFAAKFVNNGFVQVLFSPLATFDQMLRMFGGKSANGEGYLYNRFMRGWVDARQKEIQGVREKYAILDAKAKELFGGKVKTWGDLIRRVGKLRKATVSFWNGGEMQERELSQGNLMYIYMVDKMLDGRMKLRKMGITDTDVANIEQALDPRLIALADWLQEDFLVQTRNEYNETHKRLFGASMAAIEHYFPLKILANARADKPEDLDNPDKSDGISTATGAIIKRRRNALALDITGADALNVILDHVAQMEHWNAYAELNRDLNTLRTYKRFRNQVQNMTTIYGSGTKLWKKFNNVCQMAAGTYRPPRAMLDEGMVNFAKGATAAKVSFRIFTALKQFLSMPAYIPEARADHLVASLINPVGAWRWSMKHLPIFNERWRSRVAGDPRLMKSDMDWKMWRTRFMQLASRVGMSPNAFVDALTVSIGAHSMYKTRRGQYLRDGYSQSQAERKAMQDVEVLYNQTQQSSEGAFTSTMQVDRSWLSVLFTVFRNASMSYQRQLHDAVRNIKHNLTPGWYSKSVAFDKKQYEREGIDEAQALRNSRRKHIRQLLKDIVRVATFGYIMQLAWNLGAYLPYLLLGDEEEEKQKLWDDVWAHTSFGWLEGLTGGDVMSQGLGMMLGGEGNPAYLSKDMPLTSDIMNSLKKLGNGQHMDALNDMINLAVQSGIGVNQQSITDAVLAIMDACGDDPELAHEATICISRILQVPQSQIEMMYFDEVGLSGDEVSKYTPEQLAQRYAAYKVKRGRMIAPWSWDDDERLGKLEAKAKTTIKGRVGKIGDRDVNEAYQQYEEVYKGVDKLVKAAKKAAKTDYVEAARLMSEAQSDAESYTIYNAFKQMDSTLDKLVEYYMGAKTAEEAALCQQAILDYKSGMVTVLETKEDSGRSKALGDLSNVMRDFSSRYASMQSNR